MIVTVAALQYRLGDPITLEDQLHLLRRKPDFLCLSEYFSVRPGDESHKDGLSRVEPLRRALTKLSRDLACTIVGGTLAEPIDGGYANLSTVYHRGEIVGQYQKVNPLSREEERGIRPGCNYEVFDVGTVRIGILVCADVLNTPAFPAMRRMDADIIFAPTVSPLRPHETVFDKEARDRDIYVAGARTASAYVVKTCGVGTIFGHPLQGRSGIFAPWGILARVAPDSEHKKTILTAQLDISEIREFRRRMGSPSAIIAEPSLSPP